jgi:hypothetical protein
MGRWILSLAGGISLRRLGEKGAMKSGSFSLYPAGLGMSSLCGVTRGPSCRRVNKTSLASLPMETLAPAQRMYDGGACRLVSALAPLALRVNRTLGRDNWAVKLRFSSSGLGLPGTAASQSLHCCCSGSIRTTVQLAVVKGRCQHLHETAPRRGNLRKIFAGQGH